MHDYKLSEIYFLEQEWTSKCCQLVFSVVEPEHFILK